MPGSGASGSRSSSSARVTIRSYPDLNEDTLCATPNDVSDVLDGVQPPRPRDRRNLRLRRGLTGVGAGYRLAHTEPEVKEPEMGEKTDQMQGKAKEQAGRVTDDEQLEREGKLDQAGGKAKEGARKVEEGIRKAL